MDVGRVGSGVGISLQARVSCPHCWATFSPEQTLWIAEHPDLVGDPRLGADEARRFLPTRFNLDGAALDEHGFACQRLACPKCHLAVPRALFEIPPVFLSILGAPSCGKSYFLAAASWRLRRVLPKRFLLGFTDADPVMNQRLQEYESLQFLNPNQDQLVAIEKTQTEGDPYDTVLFGDQRVSFPRPFIFSVAPMEGHPNFGAAAAARALCVYDNAGESFLPGADTAASPVTRHLALSRVLIFLFDPTQDMRFRKLCSGRTDDPQMQERSERLDRERAVRQETILAEAAQRVRRFAGLGQKQRHSRPLIVAVTKFDAWSALLKIKSLPTPYLYNARGSLAAVRLEVIETLSEKLRSLLWQVSPELVSVAESFASQVLYVPVSATGRGPERDPQDNKLKFRPKDVRPIWAEVPLLYSMSQWMQGLVSYYRKPSGNGTPAGNQVGAPWRD
ncbi:MAG: hypothetical protein ABFC96_07895 [Thermoguttaceae bacterium]